MFLNTDLQYWYTSNTLRVGTSDLDSWMDSLMPSLWVVPRTSVNCTSNENEREFNSSLKCHGAFWGESRPRSRDGDGPASTFELRISPNR